MMSPTSPFNVKKKLVWRAKFWSQSACPKYDREEVPEKYVQCEKVDFCQESCCTLHLTEFDHSQPFWTCNFMISNEVVTLFIMQSRIIPDMAFPELMCTSPSQVIPGPGSPPVRQTYFVYSFPNENSANIVEQKARIFGKHLEVYTTESFHVGKLLEKPLRRKIDINLSEPSVNPGRAEYHFVNSQESPAGEVAHELDYWLSLRGREGGRGANPLTTLASRLTLFALQKTKAKTIQTKTCCRATHRLLHFAPTLKVILRESQ